MKKNLYIGAQQIKKSSSRKFPSGILILEYVTLKSLLFTVPVFTVATKKGHAKGNCRICALRWGILYFSKSKPYATAKIVCEIS